MLWNYLPLLVTTMGKSVPPAQMNEILVCYPGKMDVTLHEEPKLDCVLALRSCFVKLLLDSIAFRFGEARKG